MTTLPRLIKTSPLECVTHTRSNNETIHAATSSDIMSKIALRPNRIRREFVRICLHITGAECRVNRNSMMYRDTEIAVRQFPIYVVGQTTSPQTLYPEKRPGHRRGVGGMRSGSCFEGVVLGHGVEMNAGVGSRMVAAESGVDDAALLEECEGHRHLRERQILARHDGLEREPAVLRIVDRVGHLLERGERTAMRVWLTAARNDLANQMAVPHLERFATLALRGHGHVSTLRLGVEFKLAAFDLREASRVALGVDLTKNGGVERGVRRLAAGTGPEFLVGHRSDQFLGSHRLAGLLEDLCGCVDGADALGLVGLRGCLLRRRGVGLLGRGLLRCVRLLGLGRLLRALLGFGCHGSSPWLNSPVLSVGPGAGARSRRPSRRGRRSCFLPEFIEAPFDFGFVESGKECQRLDQVRANMLERPDGGPGDVLVGLLLQFALEPIGQAGNISAGSPKGLDCGLIRLGFGVFVLHVSFVLSCLLRKPLDADVDVAAIPASGDAPGPLAGFFDAVGAEPEAIGVLPTYQIDHGRLVYRTALLVVVALRVHRVVLSGDHRVATHDLRCVLKHGKADSEVIPKIPYVARHTHCSVTERCNSGVTSWHSFAGRRAA